MNEPAPPQPPLLDLGGESVHARWVVDVAVENRAPLLWYVRVYHNGRTVLEGWRPVSSKPVVRALEWVAGTLPTDRGAVAIRGLGRMSNEIKRLLRAFQEVHVLDRGPSRRCRNLLEQARGYLDAECSTQYHPPPLPKMDEHTLINAAMGTLELDDDTAQLYEIGGLTPREQHQLALEYVYTHLLGWDNIALLFLGQPLKLLAVRRRQVERVATQYPFLAAVAAESFYDAWTALLGDLPWPVSHTPNDFTWELKCG